MKNTKTIAIAVFSLFILPTLAHSKSYTPTQTGSAMMLLQNSPFSVQQQSNSFASNFSLSSHGSMWTNLRKTFRMEEVNPSLVRSHESKFVNNSAYFNRTIVRSTPYMYHIVNEVKKRNMPGEIALLPFIESAYVTKARSHVGASGLWQFMPATGRHYGLEQTPLYDGRHDVYASTDAALNYLQYLYGLFGDWSLALAAYNWGEGNVTRAINRAMAAGLPPTYENLRMPNETRNYVPKLLAVRNLVNNPQAYGIVLPEMKSEPYFKTVMIDKPIDVMAAAHLANISESEFLALNPAFKTPVFIPKGQHRQMLLPVNAVRTFEHNYKNSDPQTLLSWDVYTPDTRVALADIAAQTGSSVSELRRLNGISSAYVNAGRTILVNKNRASGIKPFTAFAKVDVDNTPDTFVEQAPVLPQGVATPSVNIVRQNTPAKTQTFATTSSPSTAFMANANNHQVVGNQSNTQTVSQVIQNTIKQPENDELMQLVQASQERLRAEQAVRTSLAQSEAIEARNRAAAERRRQQIAAAERAKTEATNRAREEAIARAKPATTYKVSEGDTLYSIAKRHNIDVADLIAGNNIKGNHIQTGQVLKVVFNNQSATQTERVQAVRAVANSRTVGNVRAVNAREERKPSTHVVRKGDTLNSVAERYNIKPSELKRLNGGSNTIRIGQTLKLTH
ncbi:LysM peptidoglycan-binding domain-containing protein [Wielerella bovis]|uniref:LysM peptidoglycan-binding domain-containing protein n=1 Tax=Wielerella bovis TaxID=2917790 RepID=UPI0020190926|nr:LysM peptidoglycan-binding domain-containing protein [Wielerella bovis]MCG7656556.1 LysM peptidoglycan-binding domain-containing protein [Wielerella bovis]MCG7658781.1 LysM peptidoglycan-binding domain-containing protein [Wielerella bovis]